MAITPGVGIYGGHAPATVDTAALAELLREKTAELSGAAAQFTTLTDRPATPQKEAHECIEHADPAGTFTDADGLIWAEYECRSCGETFAILASFDQEVNR